MEKNKDKMIIIDSGSHFVMDGSKNERQRLKEFIDVVRTLKNQGASPHNSSFTSCSRYSSC